jgi:iron complex transport system substrate-binding protein
MTPIARSPHPRPLRTRRGAQLAAVVAVLAVLFAACGSDGDSASSDTTPTTAAVAGPWPVTIEHTYGVTTIEEKPERIVAIDLQWTDVLLALGTTPVGFSVDATNNSTYPWQGDQLADATIIAMSGTELPYEEIAALDPDLIVGTYLVPDQNAYDLLSQIAPTIPLLGDKGVDSWQDITEVAGEVLGETEAAAELTRTVEQDITEVADAHPGLEGKTFAMVNYIPGDSMWIISDPNDGSVELFTDLGMTIAPQIVDAGKGAEGRVNVSLENTAILDADLIVIFTNDAGVDAIPGFAALPAAQSGAVAELAYAEVVGLNTPTPLSVPYSLDFIEPALAAAAG